MRPIIAVIIVVWAGAAHAQDAKVVIHNYPAYESCTQKETTTVALVGCADDETARWDKRLNAAYQRIMANKDWSPATKTLVRNAQRAWIAYRAAKCEADGELTAEGGTLAGIEAAACVATETALRATDLESALAQR